MEMKHRTGSGFDADAIDHTTAADLAAVGSDKWTRYPGCIGAFIAEMDYGLAPCIQEAIDTPATIANSATFPNPGNSAWQQHAQDGNARITDGMSIRALFAWFPTYSKLMRFSCVNWSVRATA